MKNSNRWSILAFCMCLIIGYSVNAQDEYAKRKLVLKERKQNMDRLFGYIEKLNLSVEPGIRRVSIVSISYSKNDMSAQTAELMKAEVENALQKNGFTVVKIAEFQGASQTHVRANDSMVIISHIKPINQIKSSNDSLLSLAKKYGVQGFIDCNLAYDEAKGYMLSIQLINSTTHELTASALLMSKPRASQWAGTESIICVGFGSFPKAEIKTYNNAGVIIYPAVSNYFSANLAWRQSFNVKQSGYFGFNVGVNIVQTSYDDLFYTNFLAQGGARYYLAFFERNKSKSSYYLEWFQGLGIYNARDYNLFVEQGLNINVTQNLGLSAMFNYLFGNMNLSGAHVSSGNTGFTINALYKF
ncbi:MAG: hypothetical protein V4651_10260 [Bacteroidota bacterium]